MKRYQIITYCAECGADEKQDCQTKREAERIARHYRLDEGYEGVIVYDKASRTTVSLHGHVPLSSMPT